MIKSEDWINALEATARNLKHQSRVLRQQSRDLSQESQRILAAVRQARRKRNNNKSDSKNGGK